MLSFNFNFFIFSVDKKMKMMLLYKPTAWKADGQLKKM